MTDIHEKVRPLCEWLNANGFRTTDSGDGITNVAAGMDGAMTHAHVIAVLPIERSFERADWVQANLPDPYKAWDVELSYASRNRIAILIVGEPIMDEL